MVEINSDLESRLTTGSQIVSKVLSPAIRLWLRSQVESAVGLQFQVSGSDRQILRGLIPTVAVTADQVVYQGLHLSHLHLVATQIRVNLGQVLKGKPLRLLDVVPVVGEALLSQSDLEASVSAPLLQQALAEILTTLLQRAAVDPDSSLAILRDQSLELRNPIILLQANRLTLKTEVADASGQCWQVSLHPTLQLLSPSCLQLSELELCCIAPGQAEIRLPVQPLEIDLGSEVYLQQLQIVPEHILCKGQINVIPGV